MPKVVVVCPFTSTVPERVRAFELVRSFYAEQFPTWGFAVGADHGELFSRSRAVNAVVRTLRDADVLILNDADSLCRPPQIITAKNLAAEAPGLVFAHTLYRRLSEEASAALESWEEALAGPFSWEMANAQANGCCAIGRASFLEAGGYDERYQGWGYEDLAFNDRVGALWPARRVEGELVHLWHPFEPENPANEQLYYAEHR